MKFLARSALSLGLAAVLSPAGFASGLILADNDVRNDLAWLSDRGTLSLSLSTWPLSEEEIGRALANAHPTTPAERVVLSRVNQRLRALKADLRVTGYSSTLSTKMATTSRATRQATPWAATGACTPARSNW